MALKENTPQRASANCNCQASCTSCTSNSICQVWFTSIWITNDLHFACTNNSLNDFTAKEWLPETITVFSQKGLGAGNKNAQIEKQHPAPFSFQDVGKLIQFFSKENEKVLDPFSGVASTVKACAFNNRIGYGIELNSKYHDLGLQRIELEVPDEFPLKNKQTG